MLELGEAAKYKAWLLSAINGRTTGKGPSKLKLDIREAERYFNSPTIL